MTRNIFTKRKTKQKKDKKTKKMNKNSIKNKTLIKNKTPIKNKTKKNTYGGDNNVIEEQRQKTLYRRTISNLISQITNKANSKNKIKEGLNNLINLFKNNMMINTLIPVSSSGTYIDKQTGTGVIVDFVSPVTFILDNLTGEVSQLTLIKILNSYFLNGGNINSLSSRHKMNAFKNELNKRRIENVKMLLDKSNPFHILEEGLNEEMKQQLAELIPNEQQIITDTNVDTDENTNVNTDTNVDANIDTNENVRLNLPYPLPDVEYNKTSIPEFWKPIFQDGKELLEIKNTFMELYESDRYIDDTQKRFKICDLLEKIIPGYMTRHSLQFNELVKTLVNVNILNCYITLLYGIISYKLYEHKQEYIFIFKGGRALQLCLVDIPNIGKYFSEDTDILIIPNHAIRSVYNLEKMENLSGHIAYLIKWFIPEKINIVVSLPSNPKNFNKEITKILYNDGKIYKALSDIGFGEINEDIRKYFDNMSYFPFYIDIFETISLFITPTIEDMLSEKLFYYAKYFIMKQQLENEKSLIKAKNPDGKIEMLDPVLFEKILDNDRLLIKFSRATVKLVEGIINMKYTGTDDFNKIESGRFILQNIIGNFEDYTTDERNQIISSILRNIR
jgi:hypothetical protein